MKRYFALTSLLMLGSLHVYADHQVLQYVSYTVYRDDDALDEGCITSVKLTVQDNDAQPREVALCGAGGYPRFVAYKGGTVAFIDIAGGNAAGWGLYRYTVENGQTDRYDFNAREITFEKQNDAGVWLRVAYAVHKPSGGGYLPDRVEQWYWAFDSKTPVKK